MLLVDLTLVSKPATEAALEYIFKASNDFDAGIWSPHESVLIRRMIELFSKNGLDRLEHVQQQIIAWESGANYKPDAMPPEHVPGMMVRWDQAEQALVKLYLESLPPADWTLDDHMLAVEYVVQRYMPLDELRTEAEWLTTKASLMGKVQANLAGQPTQHQADVILRALPSTIGAATAQMNLNAKQKAVMEFGRARCAENVRALSEDTRHRVRGAVLQYLDDVATREAGTPGRDLQGLLFDEFAVLNRDWRRIAVTEAGECQNQGYIASLPPGSMVERIEQYATACQFCKKIHGAIAEVVPPDAANKNGETQIWVGKTNVGRSASPRKRVGDQLVPRDEDEMYWLPAGLAHPHCRGRWIPVEGLEPGDDPEFAKWLNDLFAG